MDCPPHRGRKGRLIAIAPAGGLRRAGAVFESASCPRFANFISTRLEWACVPSRISTQAPFRGNSRAASQAGENVKASLRGAEAPRHAAALRLSPGDGRRAQVLGCPQGAFARSGGQTSGNASRGSSRLVL